MMMMCCTTPNKLDLDYKEYCITYCIYPIPLWHQKSNAAYDIIIFIVGTIRRTCQVVHDWVRFRV